MFTAEAVLRPTPYLFFIFLVKNPMFTAEAVLRLERLAQVTIKHYRSLVYCGSGIETRKLIQVL